MFTLKVAKVSCNDPFDALWIIFITFPFCQNLSCTLTYSAFTLNGNRNRDRNQNNGTIGLSPCPDSGAMWKLPLSFIQPICSRSQSRLRSLLTVLFWATSRVDIPPGLLRRRLSLWVCRLPVVYGRVGSVLHQWRTAPLKRRLCHLCRRKETWIKRGKM